MTLSTAEWERGVYYPAYEDDICILGMGRFPEKVTGCSEGGWRSGVCLRVCHWMLGKQTLWSSHRNRWDLHAQTVWVDAYSLQWGAVSGSDHGWEASVERTFKEQVAKATNTFWAYRRAGWGLNKQWWNDCTQLMSDCCWLSRLLCGDLLLRRNEQRSYSAIVFGVG